MALHETLHIYMSFHLREREIRRALSRAAAHKTRVPGSRIFRIFVPSSVIDRDPLPPREVGAPRARKRREERFCVCLVFLFFSGFFFSLPFFTLQRDSGGLRPELLVTRDSCVLRSPAGLKPDKDYHTLEMLYLPAARVKAPLSRRRD